jgi:malonyl CoA-acyl carrier protein transacylase/acyl carrier protein
MSAKRDLEQALDAQDLGEQDLVGKRIAFLFPGQGAFYPGALRETRFDCLGVERALATIEAVAVRRFGRSMVAAMWDEHNTTAELLESDPSLLQLAIYAVSVAAHEILLEDGVEPHLLMGHSFGEIAALVCAGVYTIEHGAEIVCDRVESLAASAPREGCMAAILEGPADVRAMLEEWGADRRNGLGAAALAIAVENHDKQTVVSGSESEMSAFVAYCAERKISAQRLKSPYGFHHPGLAPVVPIFAARVAAYPASPLRRPVYSPILGRYYRDGDAFGDCLAGHLASPVLFADALRFLQRQCVSVYFECGALDALSKIAIRVLRSKDIKAFPTLLGPGDELDNVRRMVAYFKEDNMLNAPESIEASAEFEAFWRERSPFMLLQIKAEFAQFLARQKPQDSAPSARVSDLARDQVKPAGSTNGGAAIGLSRVQLFNELVNIYAEAMEYPPEVFSEAVELEAELGIDSVKQTEIVGRVASLYGLPPLPANFRMGDYKTMGQIADFIFTHQRKAIAAA